MYEKRLELWKKYREMILYVIFGGATTLVNIVVYYICAHPCRIKVVPSSVIAWIVSVVFAYITNKLWVFHSTEMDYRVLLREVLSFFSARLLTGILDVGAMQLFVNVLGWNDMAVKVCLNIVVIVLNYIASKFLIFKKVRQKEEGR
ncbi:MAG: GtrA family protein [Lachnospiraceae bacterium]|jgi:putative flippase GtrA|nr:GtrA family protein [Lachnospiraceae bacterium]